MTAYGELLTPKENHSESYLIVPGFDDEKISDVAVEGKAGHWEALDVNTRVLKFKNFCFQHCLMRENSPKKSKLIVSKDLVMMLFCLQGEGCFLNMMNDPLGSFKSSAHNILWFPVGEMQFACLSKTLEIVTIYFEKEFLLKYIPEDQSLSKILDAGTACLLFGNNLYLRHKIQNVLHDMVNCEFTGHLKKLYIQAKAIELLSLQLVQYGDEANETSILKQGDIDKMRQVKDIIDNNANERLSLAYLAREAGTNEQYLKKHFKLVFGDTVFGYILSRKMEKAREMLLSGSDKISYIAELAGYKHATHFTAAFKKFYGYLPQKIKGES